MSALFAPSDYVWLWRGQAAVILGSLVFLVLLIPIIIGQYRAYGSVNARRMLGSAAASMYLAALVSYTVLPVPDPSRVVCKRAATEPLHFVDDLARAGAGSGALEMLTSRTALQIALNVALFVPWGIWVRGLLGRSVAMAVLTGGAVSILIEATQGTGLWFEYQCPYRVADIDDVLTNTIGALVGALIAPVVMLWLPRRDELARNRLAPRPISAARRWLSMVVEFGLLQAVFLGAGFAAGAVQATADGGPPAHPATTAICAVLAWSLVFGAPALRGAGSLGMAVVWLVPVWPDGTRWLALRRVARAAFVSLPWLGAQVIGGGASQALLVAVALAAVLSVPLTADRRGLSATLTGARLADARALARPSVEVERLDLSLWSEAGRRR